MFWAKHFLRSTLRLRAGNRPAVAVRLVQVYYSPQPDTYFCTSVLVHQFVVCIQFHERLAQQNIVTPEFLGPSGTRFQVGGPNFWPSGLASEWLCIYTSLLPTSLMSIKRIQQKSEKVAIFTRVFHITPFFELSYTLLTTHAHGLYEFTKKISAL